MSKIYFMINLGDICFCLCAERRGAAQRDSSGWCSAKSCRPLGRRTIGFGEAANRSGGNAEGTGNEQSMISSEPRIQPALERESRLRALAIVADDANV